jgi:hypothetical protein
MRTKTITIDGCNNPDSAYLGNMFLTGNGAMGVRGTLCEYRKEYMPAINLGGVRLHPGIHQEKTFILQSN